MTKLTTSIINELKKQGIKGDVEQIANDVKFFYLEKRRGMKKAIKMAISCNNIR